jgi:hypothetical protein
MCRRTIIEHRPENFRAEALVFPGGLAAANR